MVCVSADNPAVTTVLELTEANCVPSNQNITVQIETRGGVTPQLYARDLAITAVICFIGGVGLTLLVVLIYYHVHRRKKLKESKRQKEEEVNHLDVSEKRRELFLQTNNRKPWEREDVMMDLRSDGYERQFRSREEEDSGHLICPDCTTVGQRGMGLNLNRWNDRINGGMEQDEEREKRRMKVMMEEEGRRFGSQPGVLNRDVPHKMISQNNTNSSSHPPKETFSQRPGTLWTGMEGKGRALESLHCESCHKTYKPPEQNMKQGRNHRDLPSQYRHIDRYNNMNKSETMKHQDLRRETRNVTFDLERSRSREQRSSQDNQEEEEAFGDKERGRVKRHKAKIQSSRMLKVKLNLNPLRKSKVHPKRKIEQGNTEKSSPKKSKGKRYDGKEREDRDRKGSLGKDKKGSNKKIEKSSKAKRSIEDGEEEKEEEESEEGKKSKTSTKQRGSSSKKGQSSKGSSDVDQGENTHLENSTFGNTTNTDHQPGSGTGTGQGQSLQGGNIQYQGAGLVLGSAHHSSSLSATNRNQSIKPSLIGPGGSQLTGSTYSPQGGHFFLNTMAPRSTAPFPNSSAAPNTAIGPNMAPSGAQDSFIRQSGAGLMPPAASLQANAVHANPLQSSAMQTFPIHTAQPAGLASGLPANPAVAAPVQSSLQGHLPPDSSPLVARLKSDPVQGPGLQTGDGVHQLPTKESPSDPPQAPPGVEVLSGITHQDPPGPVITVENLSNSKSQTKTGHVPAASTVEGLAAGGSGGSMHSSDVPDSGVGVPNPSVSSTSDAVVTPALLQQEYLSEEGGSSPRRKLRLVLPEKTSSRPPTALERKIR
ncbi:uncharacterized protein lrrc53 [Labrus bergylta]|uniref:uncharacterized protein lrrc53 n=1 Tax=Labrus bergylta TaxID=56723 RepID=UPI0033132FC6